MFDAQLRLDSRLRGNDGFQCLMHVSNQVKTPRSVGQTGFYCYTVDSDFEAGFRGLQRLKQLAASAVFKLN